MGLYQRPDSPYWQYSFTARGHRFRGSTEAETRETAEIVLAKLRHDALLGLLSDKKPELTLNEATTRYWLQHGSDLPSAEATEWHIVEILKAIGKTTTLSAMNDATISRAVAIWRGQEQSNSTCNRRLTVLRAILRMARDRWGVEVSMPNWKAHWLREPAPRDRYLTTEEAEKLVACAAEHLKAPIRFSLLTGVRLRNCIELDWSQIDMNRREIRFRIKSTAPGGKPHVVPIVNELLMLLVKLEPREEGPVFLYKGKPVASFRRAWYTAMKNAGIKDFRWHDLRHTAASWMVQEGAPLDVVQEVLGHEDISTTQRYAHRDTSAKRAALEAAASRFGHVTKTENPQLAVVK